VYLKIIKSFHNYVLKYADMVRRGHLPTYSYGGTEWRGSGGQSEGKRFRAY
jgi:hypothetical protein